MEFFLLTVPSLGCVCSEPLLTLRNIFELSGVSQGSAVTWSWGSRDVDCLLASV